MISSLGRSGHDSGVLQVSSKGVLVCTAAVDVIALASDVTLEAVEPTDTDGSDTAVGDDEFEDAVLSTARASSRAGLTVTPSR